MPFAIPLVWREGKDQITDFYFWKINLKGINHKSKPHVRYFEVLSAIRLIYHGPDLPVLDSDSNMAHCTVSEHCEMTVVTGDDTYQPKEDNQPVLLTQVELNDLTRDLNLSKESAQLLGLRLKEKHLLESGTTFY